MVEPRSAIVGLPPLLSCVTLPALLFLACTGNHFGLGPREGIGWIGPRADGMLAHFTQGKVECPVTLSAAINRAAILGTMSRS